MFALSSRAQPRLAYGLWRYREDEIDAAVQMLTLARESGIDHFDTADVYGGRDGFGGAERLLGAVRARAPSLFAGACLATKAGVEHGAPYNCSPRYIAAACEASLARLGVDRIDLFYIHRPDLFTHPADLAAALDKLVREGKIAAVGVSNFSVPQAEALARWLDAPISAHQIELSAAHAAPFEDGVLDHAMREDLRVAAWSPLAGGRLGQAGNAEPGLQAVLTALEQAARRHGAAPEALALAFLLRHPAAITPILGTKTPARLKACLPALSIPLSGAEWYAILEASRGAKMP